MIIRTTTDPISLNEVPDPEHHPCVFDGTGDNGIEVYFENEENRQTYLGLETEDHKVLMGDDSADYIPEG